MEADSFYNRLIETLEAMCSQYLTLADGQMFHFHMSAGEDALEVLEGLGRVTTEDGLYYQWASKHDSP